MEQQLQLSPDDGTLLPDSITYRRLVGCLIYFIVTRSNINYAVNILSQFMHSPRTAHLDAAHRVVCYLRVPSITVFFCLPLAPSVYKAIVIQIGLVVPLLGDPL